MKHPDDEHAFERWLRVSLRERYAMPAQEPVPEEVSKLLGSKRED